MDQYFILDFFISNNKNLVSHNQFMTFIPFIPEPKVLVKKCIEKAKRTASQTRGFDKQATKKKREMIRVESLAKCLSDRLEGFVKDTANFDRIHPFYRELIETEVDLSRVKKALAVINWLSQKIKDLDRKYRLSMRKEKDIGKITRIRKQFEARVEDLIMDNEDAFEVLINAGNKLHNLPKIKEMPTVILAGYPNVGKSSILKALTGSEVEVKSYPFTTKKLMIGYAKEGYKEIQIIDTPGLLDRPMNKMNRIEKKALAALNHLSKKIVFVLDPSETCGFPLSDQLKLLDSLRKKGFDILVVANKRDLKEPDIPVDIVVSANYEEDMEELKKALFSWVFGAS